MNRYNWSFGKCESCEKIKLVFRSCTCEIHIHCADCIIDSLADAETNDHYIDYITHSGILEQF